MSPNPGQQKEQELQSYFRSKSSQLLALEPREQALWALVSLAVKEGIRTWVSLSLLLHCVSTQT